MSVDLFSGKLIVNQIIPMSSLASLADFIDDGKTSTSHTGRLIEKVLKCLKATEGENSTRNYWKEAGYSWERFIPAEKVEAFVKDNVSRLFLNI